MGYSWSLQDDSVGAGFKRIATEQIAKAVLNADAVNDPTARRIRSARRHCKRLRGLFRLVRSDFPPYRDANAAVRDAAAVLSAVRDATVLHRTLDRLYRWAGYPAPEISHNEAHPQAEEAALQQFRGAMLKLHGEAEDWPVDDIDLATLGKGFERCYGRAANAAPRRRKKRDDEAFHDWRKLVKYHSFHLILLKASLGDGVQTEIERVERLAGLLGRHHDLAVLREAAASRPELDAGFIETNSQVLQDNLAARALVLADEIFIRPARIARDSFEARWQAWRHAAPMREPA